MKKFIAIILSFICSVGSICYAQEIVKELQEEKDGFRWYQLKQDKYFGASDLNGNTIIPLSKKFVSLMYMKLEYQDRGFFYVYDENEYEGLFEKSGREIISTDRGYNVIIYHINDEGYKWFEVRKDNIGEGVCDLTGKELISPQLCDGIIYSDDNFKVCKDANYKNTGIKLSKKDPLNKQ